MRKLQRYRYSIKKASRFFTNMVLNAAQSYILNFFRFTEIHNDLGASSTSIKRRRTQIIKKAITPDAEIKLANEVGWIREFSKGEAREFLPVVKDFSLEPGNTFYTMTYYNMPNFRKIILNNMSTFYFLEKRVDFLLRLQTEVFHSAYPSIKPEEDYFKKVYEKKFFDRIAKGCEIEPEICEIVNADSININKKRLIGCKPLFSAIAADEAIRSTLIPEELCISHGDLHCNNILCGIPVYHIKLLDCRGKNSDGSYYFDPAYDIGKLYHDFHGLYSLIEKHMFTIETNRKNSIDYSFSMHKSVVTFGKLYNHTRKQVDVKYARYGDVNYRADFTEAMLFLTMIIFHFSNFNEGLLCLTRGIEFLNNWAEKYHPKFYAALQEKTFGNGAEK
ncbi:MAG: hypothetical protein HQ557_02560 [Bacteroidetes bacterium]|nr:hypothetical protein [Bacteroidota bacterium]